MNSRIISKKVGLEEDKCIGVAEGWTSFLALGIVKLAAFDVGSGEKMLARSEVPSLHWPPQCGMEHRKSFGGLYHSNYHVDVCPGEGAPIYKLR